MSFAVRYVWHCPKGGSCSNEKEMSNCRVKVRRVHSTGSRYSSPGKTFGNGNPHVWLHSCYYNIVPSQMPEPNRHIRRHTLSYADDIVPVSTCLIVALSVCWFSNSYVYLFGYNVCLRKMTGTNWQYKKLKTDMVRILFMLNKHLQENYSGPSRIRE